MLYGLYTILSNACFLIGYYLLPEGFMRGSPHGCRTRCTSRSTLAESLGSCSASSPEHWASGIAGCRVRAGGLLPANIAEAHGLPDAAGESFANMFGWGL
jgi:hypothetical protein